MRGSTTFTSSYGTLGIGLSSGVEGQHLPPSKGQSQNALFHIWCREMSEHFKSQGMDLDQEQCKEVLKYKFLGCADIVVNNTVIPQQLKKTSKLPLARCTTLWSRCSHFCSIMASS